MGKDSSFNFTDGITRLGGIKQEMDEINKQGLPIEKAESLVEEAATLSKQCLQYLDSLEHKVETLLANNPE